MTLGTSDPQLKNTPLLLKKTHQKEWLALEEAASEKGCDRRFHYWL